MKSFALALLATVAAQTGYTCTTATGWTEKTDATLTTDITDAAKCETAGKALAEGDAQKDWCLAAVVTDKVGETAASLDTCKLYEKATAADADIRAVLVTDLKTNSAWAWAAGVAMADVAAEDSASAMMTSFAAVVATIAMVAY